LLPGKKSNICIKLFDRRKHVKNQMDRVLGLFPTKIFNRRGAKKLLKVIFYMKIQ
jgi:hypothetical protein